MKFDDGGSTCHIGNRMGGNSHSRNYGDVMMDNEPDPRFLPEALEFIASLREKANVANMLQNDNVDYKLNIDRRDFYRLVASDAVERLANAGFR